MKSFTMQGMHIHTLYTMMHRADFLCIFIAWTTTDKKAKLDCTVEDAILPVNISESVKTKTRRDVFPESRSSKVAALKADVAVYNVSRMNR